MEWQLPAGFDAEGTARRVAAEPDLWTDGSLVEDKVSGASSAGAGCFTFRCSRLWAGWRWGHLDEEVGVDEVVSACRGFCSVPGPLQSVQRAEFGVLFLLCRLLMEHILGLCGMLAASWMARLLLEWVEVGDLILFIERMLRLRGLDTVRTSGVSGHADEALVRAGGARDLDRLGNDGADEAADFGRWRVSWWVIDARRNFSGVCALCHPGVLARAAVNHDGAGTSMDPTVCSVSGA